MQATPLHILLVEDSASDAVLLQEALLELNPGQFRFTHVETLQEGLAALQRSRFDVLLLDLSLPDSAGRETFLRARAAAPGIPIVVLTGVEDEAVALEAVRQGIQDYLVKTQVHGQQTVRALRYAIERHRAEEALKQAEAALQAERDQLEQRVLERTAALQAANQALLQENRHRQQAEAAHHQVLRRLSEAEETERGRISRELHDQLGQDLTTLKLGLQMLRQKIPGEAPVQESLSRLEALAANLMRHTHRLAWELRPSVLDDLGLVMALQRYSAEWSETSGVPVDFHSRGLEGQRLPKELESALYRVAQECLTNVARHAQARQVSVLLECRADCVSLIIEDDGRGFDPEATLQARAQTGKLGLLGIQERVKLVAGTVDMESSPGAGTTVYVRLPRQREEET
jgi:signal transduction histidine kinase